MALFVDDAIWESPRVAPSGVKIMRSCAEEETLVRTLLDRVSGRMRYQLQTMTAEDDRVAAVVISEAALTDGGEYRNCYHFLFYSDGHRLTRVSEYSDTLRIAEALAPPGSDFRL